MTEVIAVHALAHPQLPLSHLYLTVPAGGASSGGVADLNVLVHAAEEVVLHWRRNIIYANL